MNDTDFISYCSRMTELRHCGFYPHNLARLLRLAGPGYEEEARYWEQRRPIVVDFKPDTIRTLVTKALARLPFRETFMEAAA